MIDPIRPGSDSLLRRTTDTLRQMIVEGTLRLGEALSEAKVAQWLDVSRTPVREAFARLEIEGLVVSEPQRRTRVFMLGPKDVDDICVVRGCLETRALTLSVERHQTELAADLARTASRMTEAMQSQNFREYLRHDSQFHQSIFDHADNVFLSDAYQTIAAKLAALRTRLPLHVDYLKKGYGEHLRLSELIAAGDLARALIVLEMHISRQEDSFWHLDDGLVDLKGRRNQSGRGDGEMSLGKGAAQIIDRRKLAPQTADPIGLDAAKTGRRDNLIDDNAIQAKYIDEKYPDISVDKKYRGRPRVHSDDAARKRVWAARARQEKRTQRLILGQSPPKRGRPRKADRHADRPSGKT